jgi:hypothetical protein
MAAPLGLAAGATVKVTFRGLLLEGATEARAEGAPLTLKIVAQGKAPLPPNTDAKLLGDTQVEVEVTAPADMPPGDVKIKLVTPKGESAPHPLLIVARDKLVAKREPNGGFAEAQPIELGQVVEGSIEQARNVDVYRLELAAGQRLVAEVLAARYGSALDPLLTLYDSRGKVLTAVDDTVGKDPRLEFSVGAAGTYFLVLVDALDAGGPTHPYQLTTRGE